MKEEPSAASLLWREAIATLRVFLFRSGEGSPLDAGLCVAAMRGDVDMARRYLTRGADPNASAGGVAALDVAAQYGHIGVVDLMLNCGANANCARPTTLLTPLISAARAGHVQVVRILLEAGADIHARALHGTTALIGAAMHGHLSVVEELLNHGADVNESADLGTTALMAAVLKGHSEVARLLVARGADVSASTSYGATALSMARRKRRRALATWLESESTRVRP